MLFIDRILEANGSEARAEATVKEGPWISGGDPWQLGLVEGMAQTAAALMSTRLREEGLRVQKGMLVGIRGLQFRGRIHLADRVVFQVKLTRRLGPLALALCSAFRGDEVVAQGELKFFVESCP